MAAAVNWLFAFRAPSALIAIGCTAALVAAGTPARAFDLVTPAEAALPAAALPTLYLRGSPTRRPTVVVVSPPPTAGQIHSPMDLKLQFRAFGGAAIDPSSIVITYVKQPAIDMTQRLTPYITAQGIDIAQAQVPPGKHQFWIELKDTQGRVGGGPLTFQVGQ